MVFKQFALLLCGAGLALAANAKITCCEAGGKRHCGDPMPAQCLDKTKRVFDKGGVAHLEEAPLTREQREERAAEDQRKKEEERKRIEQERKDRALLASYTSAKEIDKALNRAIADIEKNAEQAQGRLDAALKKRTKLEQEKEFYKKKPMPAALKTQIADNESEIEAQQKALQQKDVDIAAVKSRFDADKARYQQLSGR